MEMRRKRIAGGCPPNSDYHQGLSDLRVAGRANAQTTAKCDRRPEKAKRKAGCCAFIPTADA
jgi:hypothetical protein